MDTARGIWGKGRDNIDPARLDPAYRYVKLVINGTPLVLALGSIDATPEGPTENWYSATGELLRIRDGRIVATAGIDPVDWRGTASDALPSWQQVAETPGRVWFYKRTRDVMPGYRFGLRDEVTIAPIARPDVQTLPAGLTAERLAWFRETGVTSGAVGDDADVMQPAIYGVDLARSGSEAVVYLKQCLSKSVCLTLQRLPVAGKAG